MKRIINGVTYDTSTSVEVYSVGHEFSDAGWAIYQTRHGSFFKAVFDYDGDLQKIVPLSDADTERLMEKHCNHLLDKFFGKYPEYGSGERRLTVRIPNHLHKMVTMAAQADGLDVNKFIQKTLQNTIKALGLDNRPM